MDYKNAVERLITQMLGTGACPPHGTINCRCEFDEDSGYDEYGGEICRECWKTWAMGGDSDD